MATQLQIRRGTNSQVAAFTGAEGEIVVNTTNDSVHVNDGSTAGGFEMARADLNNVSDTSLNAALTGNTVSALTITTLTLGSTAITATGTELNLLDGVTATTAELNYVDGVTSAIQTQINTKAPLASPTFTGTATMDGLTVDSTTGFSWLPVSTAGAKVGAIGTGTGLIINTPSVNSSFGSGLAIDGSYASDLSSVNVKAFGPKFSSYGSELNLFTSDDTSLLKRQTIASNGDISFYEDTGTTPKLFWDASAESLGIGTSSPSRTFHSLGASGISTAGKFEAGGSQVYVQLSSNGQADGDSGYIGYDSSKNLALFTDNTERLRITSAGNAGIGTTSPSTKLQVTGNSSSRNTIVSNVTLDGGTTVAYPYSGFGFGINFIGRDYGNAVRNYASINTVMEATSSNSGGGDAGFKAGLSFYTNGGGASDTDPQERMRIDSLGNVGIGVVPEAWHSAFTEVLQVGVASLITSGGDNARVFSNAYYDGAYKRIGTGYAHSYEQTGGTHRWFSAASGSADSSISWEESMRIDPNGCLLRNTTSSTVNSSGGEIIVLNDGNRAAINVAADSTSSRTGILFTNPNGTVGSISMSGSGISIVQSSDQRLKDNIQDAEAEDAGALIDAIQVRQFDWKADGSHQRFGMVAQELTTVAPEAVSAPEDPDEMMGVDYSKLVPMLVKEIQSLRARVTQLENN